MSPAQAPVTTRHGALAQVEADAEAVYRGRQDYARRRPAGSLAHAMALGAAAEAEEAWIRAREAREAEEVQR